MKKEEKKEKEVSKEIPKEIEEQVLSDDRFLCLTEKLELTDILEFLYTGILSEKICLAELFFILLCFKMVVTEISLYDR